MFGWRVPFQMARHHARNIALALWCASMLLAGLAALMDVLILLDRAPGGSLPAQDLYYEPGYVVLATFGALIIARWPDQVIGWLFCGASLLAIVAWLSGAYEQFAGAEALPLLVPIIWLGAAVSISHMLVLLIIVPYLFPTGKLLSARWKPLFAISVAVIVGTMTSDSFGSEVIGNDDRQLNANPLYIGAVKSLFDVLTPVGIVVAIVVMLGAVISLGLRYRHASGVERLQIRWLFWMLGVIIALVLTLMLGEILTPAWINMPDGHWTRPELVIGLSILTGIYSRNPVRTGIVNSPLSALQH